MSQRSCTVQAGYFPGFASSVKVGVVILLSPAATRAYCKPHERMGMSVFKGFSIAYLSLKIADALAVSDGEALYRQISPRV